MTNSLYNSNFSFYQNANADASSIKGNFLIRKNEYQIIIDDIRQNQKQKSTQHYLLLGRRGSGKSTLLRRLQVEIDSDKKLDELYIAINPAEEQANIYRLSDLLEEIIKELECRGIEVGEYEFHEDTGAYIRQLFSMIHSALETKEKKLILLLDNIDRIFENVGVDAHLLREDLLNYGDIKIIGGSTRLTEHFWKYDKPFYEFFRVLELKPLTSEEVKTLLLNWSERLNLPQIKEFVTNKPGQLETIRLLTDGLPRTLQFFVNILLTRAPETGYEYLKLIMDNMTPLYQERLNILPPAQRKIVLQMAFIWEAAGAGDIAIGTRMVNNVVSAQLKQLAEKGIVEKIDTGGRNHLYRLAERFFNLWLIFTQGSPREKRKAKYLTVFLENFYDSGELRKLAEEHLTAMKDGDMEANKAALLTKAYSQSRYISIMLRESLIAQTLLLPGVHEDLKKQLPASLNDILRDVMHYSHRGAWKKALELAENLEQDGGFKDFLIGTTYLIKKDAKKAEPYLLSAYEKGIAGIAGVIAQLYLLLGRLDLAEKYIQRALEEGEGNPNTYFLYILIHYYQNKARQEMLVMIKHKVKEMPTSKLLSLLPVIKVWNADFQGLESDLKGLVKNRNSMFSETLLHMLIHHQARLVNKLFSEDKFGEQLTDELLPFYYVTQLLVTEDIKKKNLSMPPELIQPVAVILRQVKIGQELFYKKD
ncbi:MAG TPA: AAA family ATPase [Puia sp.]|nr:AAA family ATPase [Puia sp.]